MSRVFQFECLIHTLTEKYGKPECGRGRATFLSKKYVFKVPRNLQGDSDNLIEAWSYETRRNNYLARCRIIQINEIPVLVMERLNTEVETKDMPDWADFVDCRQVGYDRYGEFKAYDYASND